MENFRQGGGQFLGKICPWIFFVGQDPFLLFYLKKKIEKQPKLHFLGAMWNCINVLLSQIYKEQLNIKIYL